MSPTTRIARLLHETSERRFAALANGKNQPKNPAKAVLAGNVLFFNLLANLLDSQVHRVLRTSSMHKFKQAMQNNNVTQLSLFGIDGSNILPSMLSLQRIGRAQLKLVILIS